MSIKLYYIAPEDTLFEELKATALGIWRGLMNEGGDPQEVNESISQITKMQNISDNFMYIVAMFDQGNRAKLLQRLSPVCKEAVEERIKSVS